MPIKGIIQKTIFAAVAIIMLILTSEDYLFLMQKKPLEIKNVNELLKLKANKYVKVYLPLDLDEGIVIRYVTDKEISIYPISQTNRKVCYAVESPLSKDLKELIPPFEGRLFGKRFDEWDVCGKSVKLNNIFKKELNVDLPKNTLVLCYSDRSPFNIWIIILAILSILYVLYYAFTIYKFMLKINSNYTGNKLIS
jgi:hypothetical protein